MGSAPRALPVSWAGAAIRRVGRTPDSRSTGTWGRTVGGLGPTRAAKWLALRPSAAPCSTAAEGRTTSELAARVGLSPPTVSHHVAVLRESGLLTSRRIGGTVLHTVTGLGADLLGGGVTCGIRPRSKAVVRSGR
ncbi:helix-turn-helix domain-containing protein [Streptomyces europaeiscabiei]|uniref:helix-turn-helix domain-containing protein n=1 Tax=Streptomyces europaeiscabiei TaxID=146819 RepID=UPI0029ADFA32|nr:helix-turn-helix domain-containing protein [Streptomyces europaeiscabiei]MDX2774689.1 helix-turn-helix domain-containing protein [Streptomyces europaeiscabiei]